MNNRILYPFIEVTNRQGKITAIIADEIEALCETPAEAEVKQQDGTVEKKNITITVICLKSGQQHPVYESIEQIGKKIEQAVNTAMRSIQHSKGLVISNGSLQHVG